MHIIENIEEMKKLLDENEAEYKPAVVKHNIKLEEVKYPCIVSCHFWDDANGPYNFDYQVKPLDSIDLVKRMRNCYNCKKESHHYVGACSHGIENDSQGYTACDEWEMKEDIKW